MPKLDFKDFISCFKKQFIFQKGHGGRRVSDYFTAKNYEQGIRNDQWAIMVLIYTGSKYGFSDEQLITELKIKKNLYEFLKEETYNAIQRDYHDKTLHQKIVCKIGLVENCVRYTHHVTSSNILSCRQENFKSIT